MQFCTSCNQTIPAAVGACPHCGAPLVAVPDLDFAPRPRTPPAAPKGATPLGSAAGGAPGAGVAASPAGSSPSGNQGFRPAEFAARAEMSVDDIEPVRLELMDEGGRRSGPVSAQSQGVAATTAIAKDAADRPADSPPPGRDAWAQRAGRAAVARYAKLAFTVAAVIVAVGVALRVLAWLLASLGIGSPGG